MNLTPAEILDRASILKVKIRELVGGSALAPQLAECFHELRDYPEARVMELFYKLHEINSKIWEANEKFFRAMRVPFPHSITASHRILENVKLAHELNNRRVALKNEINAEFGVNHREEKSVYAC